MSAFLNRLYFLRGNAVALSLREDSLRIENISLSNRGSVFLIYRSSFSFYGSFCLQDMNINACYRQPICVNVSVQKIVFLKKKNKKWQEAPTPTPKTWPPVSSMLS
jgi:hypothetical protein